MGELGRRRTQVQWSFSCMSIAILHIFFIGVVDHVREARRTIKPSNLNKSRFQSFPWKIFTIHFDLFFRSLILHSFTYFSLVKRSIYYCYCYFFCSIVRRSSKFRNSTIIYFLILILIVENSETDTRQQWKIKNL